MFRNQYIFFLFLFILHLTISGCASKFKLSNGGTITKKEILSEVEAFRGAQESSKYYKSEKLSIRKRSEEKTDKITNLYKTINDLNLGKLSKTYPMGRKSICYIKTGIGSKTYYQPDMINLFQSKSINDDLFNEEIDRIIHLLENGEITMSEIKENLNEEYDIGVQYYKNTTFSEEKKFKPDAIDLLKNKKIGSVIKSEKVTIGKATFLTLIQNVGVTKENPVCYFLSILLL